MGRRLQVLRLRLRSLLFRGRVDRELDDELQYHLDQLARDKEAQGLPVGEARRVALASMGGLLQRREECRDARGIRPVEEFIYDLRYAARQLRQTPGFTIAVVAVLALGIGGNTAMFSVARAALAPLSIPQADRVVMVWTENPARNWHQFPASMPDVIDWRATAVFASLAPFTDAGFNLRLPSRTDRVEGLEAGEDLFAVLGIQAAQGRTYRDADGDAVVVITERLWRTTFNQDPAIVGRSVMIDGTPHTIVGVVPAGAPRLAHEDIYAPVSREDRTAGRGTRHLAVVGRLREGLSLAAAQQRMTEVSAVLAKQYPQDDGGQTVALQPLQDAIVQDAALILNLLIAAVGCALAVACANVASLLLSRGTGRRRELAIRTALGGGRWRLTRQLLTEHLLLGVIAGAVAIVPAWYGVHLIVSYQLEELPNASTAGLHAATLAFNFLVALAVGLLCGVAPAWMAWKNDVNAVLKSSSTIDAGRSQQRIRKLFVIGQVAFTMMLLVAGGLVLRSFADALSESPGYDPSGVLTMRVALSEGQYSSPVRQAAFYRQVVERASVIPGVNAASATRELPTSSDLHGGGLIIDGRPEPSAADVPLVLYTAVLPDYFRTMAIPLVAGRPLTTHDTSDAPRVALIDHWTASKYWPDENPVGRRFKLGRKQPWLEIAGVVGDVEVPVVVRFMKGRVGQAYLPLAQDPHPAMTFVVRTAGDPSALVAPMRAIVREVDPDQPVFKVQTLAEARDAGRAVVRLVMVLLSGFGIVALVLATIGLYGTVAYDVRQRTREFGLRMSLGARPGDLLADVVRRGAVLLGIGVCLGFAGTLAGIRLLSNALYGVRTHDPLTLALAPGLLIVTGLIASYLPALRATRISPMTALRVD